MSVARARHSKSLAFTMALALLLALAIPFGGIAFASHQGTNDNQHTLDVEPETDTNAIGTSHTLTATVANGSCAAGCEVDFEIESGPAARVNCTPTNGTCSGGTANNDGNTPLSPDMTCTTTTGTCSVVFTSDAIGDHLIRAWVDDGGDNATFDADQTEGRDHTALNQGGTRTDPDDTDVVQKTWFSEAGANVVLDCRDDDAVDTETNAPGAAEVYTCRAYNNNGTLGNTADDTPVSGQLIDAENLAGANDPDNSAAAGTADFNNACTTAGAGTCQFTLTPSENETGTANVCFWIDEDNDTQFDPAGAEFDGGACGEGVTADEPETNKTDVVAKTWATPAPTTLDAEPERDSNVKGTQHTVTATVRDQFGGPSANVPVDFTVTGANTGQGCNNVLTNAQGVATCTYTDGTTVVGPEPETDTIDVRVDGTAGVEAVDDVDADLIDVVEKFWFTTIPVANNLILDMNAANGCAQAADSTATNEVATNHDLCGTVFAGPGQSNPIAGANVALTISGPGEFVNEGTTPGNTGTARDDDVLLGKSITVTTNAAGEFRATQTSTETGTTTVTATSGTATDTGTKTWTTPALGARVIDCEPETDTNPPGTSHVVTCTVTDRFGNPVAGVGVTPNEVGPGRLDNSAAVNTDVNGQVEFVTSTTLNEEGDQTITGQLTADVPDNDTATDTDDPCDQPAGTTLAAEPGGAGTGNTAPAGACEDSVTKTWGEVGPVVQCNDGIDNDGDGLIDFPDDPQCSSATDDSERGFVPGPCRNRGAGENVIVGTSGADVLTGTSGRDIICGAGGDDVIAGRGGSDLIVGNGGDDTISGGRGKDNVSGNRGNDNISGNRGNDAIKGNGGRDTLKGNKGIDTLVGGGGNDTLQGGAHADILKGGRGNDTLRGGKGDDALDGGPGNDQCFGNAGNDSVRRCE